MPLLLNIRSTCLIACLVARPLACASACPIIATASEADCITPSVAPANESIRFACRSAPYTPPTNERTSAICARRRSAFAMMPPQVIGAEPRAASRSGGLAAAADEVGEAGHRRGAGGTEPGAEIVPERDAELLARLAEAEEGVTAVAPGVAFGPAADLALGHLAADVVLRTIGVQRDLRVVEHHQELGLVGVQPLEQPIEGGKAGGAQEDAVEARPHFAAAARRRCQAIGLEVGVVPPDQPADMLLGGALLVGERLQLVHQALGMDPAQAMLADIELPGVVADDDRLVQEPVVGHGTPQRALGGDAHRVGGHLQSGHAELLKVALPGGVVGKPP